MQMPHAQMHMLHATCTCMLTRTTYPCPFRQTNRDFSKGLREHALGQIEFEAAQQREWTELLRVFENVPAAAEL